MVYFVLSGGRGSSLWPMSREKFAKQFLKYGEKYSLFQKTLLRVTDKDFENVYVLTHQDFKFIVIDQIIELFGKVDEDKIFIEPVERNTAAAVAYRASFFDDDQVIAVLPCDHYVENDDKYKTMIDDASVTAKNDKIVLFGIKPLYANSEYGYIKKSNVSFDSGFIVEKYKEKPNLLTAEKFFSSEEYLWNTGILVFKVGVFLEELKKFLPGMYNQISVMCKGKSIKTPLSEEEYSQFEKISIDYGLLEFSDKLVVIPSDINFRDISSFQSLYEVSKKTVDDNVLLMNNADYINIDSKNLLISASGKKVSTIGVSNLIIVDTPDVLMIADDQRTDEVKEVYGFLKDENAPEYELHKTVHRPWGSYTNIMESKDYKVKHLLVNPGSRISLQYHNHRNETWTITSGTAEVTKGDEVLKLSASETVYIPIGEKHRLRNPSKTDFLEVIEVQKGTYLGEDDIIRLSDDFKRG